MSGRIGALEWSFESSNKDVNCSFVVILRTFGLDLFGKNAEDIVRGQPANPPGNDHGLQPQILLSLAGTKAFGRYTMFVRD